MCCWMTTTVGEGMSDGMSDGSAIAADNARWLTPGVGAVSVASFLSDAGHEVTTSVLPAFISGTLGASAAALGVIDGISDALIGAMKLIGGPLANDPHPRGHKARLLVIWAPRWLPERSVQR